MSERVGKLSVSVCHVCSASSVVRGQESTDYGTDQLGEWSSHSSEGDTDPEAGQEEEEEEEEEGEEEAGVIEEPPPMRLRSTSKV